MQVGSHGYLPQANAALSCDCDTADGQRLDVAAGTTVRLEPGTAQSVDVVPIGGARVVPRIFLGALAGDGAAWTRCAARSSR